LLIIPELAPSSAGLRRTAAGWTGLRRTGVEACGTAAFARARAGLAAGAAARRAGARAAVAVRRPLLEAPFFGLFRAALEPFFAVEAFFDD